MSTLRVMRAAQGISQEDLAKRANLRRETVSRAETGFAHPTPNTAERIAKVLGVSAEELFPTTEGDPMEVVRWLTAGPAVKQDLEHAVEALDRLRTNLQNVLAFLEQNR